MGWSAGFRFLVVGLLALIMYVPLFLVGGIIDSRVNYSRQTISDVGREWGGPQTIGAPHLVIPVEGPKTRRERREVIDPETGEEGVEWTDITEMKPRDPVYLLPTVFDVDVDTASEERSRGIFTVPVYRAATAIRFGFDTSGDVLRLKPDEVPLWDKATLRVSLTSNRALRGEARLLAGTRELVIETYVRDGGTTAGGIVAETGDPRKTGEFELKLGLNGAQQLYLTPAGRIARVSMVSDWPHPSFGGAFLPDSSDIGDGGFEAVWTIPHLARSVPMVSRVDYDDVARAEAFGVRFYQPNDFYQKAYRAARYGLLFIALTFLTVLLIERQTGQPTHPVQYILIGLAQSVFVLLMVSYAEQIGFGPAYLVASAATIGLLVMFGFTGLRFGRRTWVLACMLLVLYGVLYFILLSADYALIAGSTVAFLALAGTIHATRNEKWFDPERARRWRTGKPAPSRNSTEDGGHQPAATA
jgi:inner membrane protein